jgi:RNA-directed DNA polymerase
VTATTKGKTVTEGRKPFDYTLQEVMAAFRAVKANRGAAGVDHVSLHQFEEHLTGNLYKIYNRLASGSYFPPPVRAVAIPKKSGGERILQ